MAAANVEQMPAVVNEDQKGKTKPVTIEQDAPKQVHAEDLPTLMTNEKAGNVKQVEAAVVGADEDQEIDVEAGAGEVDIKARSVQITVLVHEQNPCLRILTYLTAVTLFFFSLLAMFNVFFFFRYPFLYILMAYNMFCAGVIMVMDGRSTWFRGLSVAQARLFRMIPCLATRPGRAFFYIAVGCFNTSFMGWSWLFALCGSLLNMCGFLTLVTFCCGC